MAGPNFVSLALGKQVSLEDGRKILVKRLEGEYAIFDTEIVKGAAVQQKNEDGSLREKKVNIKDIHDIVSGIAQETNAPGNKVAAVPNTGAFNSQSVKK